MPPIIFRFLNELSSVQTIKQDKNISETLTETVSQMSDRHWNQVCFASHYFFSSYFSSNYRRLNACGSMDEIRQAFGNYKQQLNDIKHRICLKDTTSTFMKGFIRGIELLVSQPSSLEKIPKTDDQSIQLSAKASEACPQDSGIPVKLRSCSNIPANIRTDIRSIMKKAGYHPDEEGMCYGVAWTALLACIRQDGQVYMQRMQYLAQMDNPPLPGADDKHQVYPFFDAVTLSMTSYKNMNGYEKGIGYRGRQEVAFPGSVIGGHEPDYQVPVVKQTFIAECTPETFIRFLQQTQKNNNGIPFGVMIHYPGHATSIGFDGNKWLATDHDSHYYTETTELLYTFFDEQSGHYKDGRIVAAMEMVAGNEHTLNITGDTLVVSVQKSVSAPLALHLALQCGYVKVITDCITVIGQQTHTPEILLEQLTCKDARGTPGLYMALQKGYADAITAFMQTSAMVIATLSLPEAQKAELLYRLFSSRNACLYPGARTYPQETAGGKITSRKRTPSEQTDAEAKRSKANAPTCSQKATGNSIPSRKRLPTEQKDSKAKRNKRSAVKEKQSDNLQSSTALQGSRLQNTKPVALSSIDVSAELDVLKSYFSFRISNKESEAAKKLFQILNSKKIKIKDTFYKLLANNVGRNDLRSFCAKASVFFSAITDTVKDTGCLTSMFNKTKKHILDFVEREDEELEYLAGLDTFRSFSSMSNCKGLPKKEAVKALLDWKVWRLDGVFKLDLFRAFSSMNCSKGLPKKEAVEAMLSWKVWKPEGVFSMELFRAFSSMNNGKGLPKKEAVEEILGWDVWKQEGVFNLELFRAFSSMNHSKGLPKKEAVEEILGWDVWKQEGVFNLDLFRAFSSMSSSRGLPKKEVVEAMLGWEVWKPEGVFNMELFRAFSSMNSSKGLPKKEEVEAVLSWEVWKLESVFSMELFRAFSSMNNGKGLPKKKEVEAVLDWKVWKPEGTFSLELFRAFSSINHGKGLPKKKEVKAVLDWKVWKPEGTFSLELFRAFFSMNHGKGLPKKEEVEALLDWDVWKSGGVFSMELFRVFSSMNLGKGLPKKEVVEEMLDWLKGKGVSGASLFKLASRLYGSEGMPDIKNLKQYEQKLLNLFFTDSTGLKNHDKDKHLRLIQPVALFLSTRKSQHVLSFRDVEHFYQQESGEPASKLKKLLNLLVSYGGKGVIRYLTLNNEHRELLLHLSSLRMPLQLTIQTITDFSPEDRRQYLFFIRNLKKPPDKGQWNNLSLKLSRLASVLKTLNNQRRYLEVIWRLAPSDRDTFLDVTHAAHVIAVFPSLNALHKLAKSYSQQKLKALFNDCQQLKQGIVSIENITRLFVALLETGLPLYSHSDIPDHFLSGCMAMGDSATFIPITPPIETAEKLALYFVAAVTGVLSDTLYHYEANRLKIEQCTGGIYPFPIPKLEIQDGGIKISNWPVEVFRHFLAETEFPEYYYLSQEQWHVHCTRAALCLLPQSRLSILTSQPVTVKKILTEEERFQRLWEKLSRKALLEDNDLQLLTGYKEYMTMEHIVNILKRTHAAIEPCRLDQLRQLLDEKKDLYSRKDPFFITLSNEVISYLMEAEMSRMPE